MDTAVHRRRRVVVAVIATLPPIAATVVVGFPTSYPGGAGNWGTGGATPHSSSLWEFQVYGS
jgi:hypothetical protein